MIDGIDRIDVKQLVGCGAKLCFVHVETSERPRAIQGNSYLFAASKLTQLSASPTLVTLRNFQLSLTRLAW